MYYYYNITYHYETLKIRILTLLYILLNYMLNSMSCVDWRWNQYSGYGWAIANLNANRLGPSRKCTGPLFPSAPIIANAYPLFGSLLSSRIGQRQLFFHRKIVLWLYQDV